MVVAIIALVKGNFPFFHIKTRKFGAVVLVISLFVFIAGLQGSGTSTETASENINTEATSEYTNTENYEEMASFTDTEKPVATEESPVVEEPVVEKKANKITDGMYKVGKDIPAGEYIIYSKGMSYFCISADSTGELDSRLI